jgi:hypothetical protein
LAQIPKNLRTMAIDPQRTELLFVPKLKNPKLSQAIRYNREAARSMMGQTMSLKPVGALLSRVQAKSQMWNYVDSSREPLKSYQPVPSQFSHVQSSTKEYS